MLANPFKTTSLFSRAKGFTLIELVVGMVVLSIALVMLATMMFPQADRAVDTLSRVRSAELAHSLLNEIWGKRYDQNTNANGGVPACGAAARPDLGLPAGLACTPAADLGPDTGETRNTFNDVDDYNGLNQNSKMLNSNDTYLSQYKNYLLSVSVTYPNPNRNSKLIAISVTTPSGEAITYDAIRSNY
ncbi:type II secretion system GspH family protein [Shewanella sp. D64]|uniref:type II secretion system protein n=1 Tax=unclassified Shewanella TaxID=196818 RepID=UPI0022BA39C0|nr:MULTISPECIES: type II secretion system protein [unclassified Shewanella]MEC4725450.1 type II secretion system GspH family protein [Shewanella sp. D64]MEC4738731.1 type II secretion system GspH family protein [Shewanella sp. E94]WBJ95025.1 type II secretion system GspH family protein [Shewanella sp. MTB7]